MRLVTEKGLLGRLEGFLCGNSISVGSVSIVKFRNIRGWGIVISERRINASEIGTTFWGTYRVGTNFFFFFFFCKSNRFSDIEFVQKK